MSRSSVRCPAASTTLPAAAVMVAPARKVVAAICGHTLPFSDQARIARKRPDVRRPARAVFRRGSCYRISGRSPLLQIL